MTDSAAERMGTILRQAGEGARLLLASIAGGLAYLRGRRIGVPRARVGVGQLEAVAIAAGVIGVVAALMLLVDPSVPGLRQRLPGGLIAISERVTDLGYSGVLLWPLGLGLAYALLMTHAADTATRHVAAAVAARLGFLFLAIAPVGLGVALVKHLLGRPRPYAALQLPGPNPTLSFDLLAWKSSFASFPSGHATTTLATAVAFGALFPRARWTLLLLALPVAATRLVLGSHYPSDVVAGGAIGAAFALWMVKVFADRRMVFRVDAGGHIAPMAGPSARRLGLLLPRTSNAAVPAEEARP